jgi:MFS family permease
VFVGCILLMATAEIMLATDQRSLMAVGLGLLLFFIAFNVLEASLPSLISRLAPADSKGSAIGVYSTSQFFCAFLGGAGGGLLYGLLGTQGVFFACAVAALVWAAFAMGMTVPAYLSSFMVPVHFELADTHAAAKMTEQILEIEGVHEATVVLEDAVAYLKVDQQQFNQDAVARITGSSQSIPE